MIVSNTLLITACLKLILNFHRGMNIDFLVLGFLRGVRGEFLDDVSEVSVDLIFTGHESERKKASEIGTHSSPRNVVG
jgi:hypothetical protein